MSGIGNPIAKIIGGRYDGKTVYISDQFNNNEDNNDDGLIRQFRRLKLANDSRFQQIPNPKRERDILYITGQSGSGKSTYTRKYLEQFKKLKGKKDTPIYLFSSLTEDESLDSVDPKRVKLDESLCEDPIEMDEIKDSVCIFDDIDVISKKKVKECVFDILNKALEIGRHYHTTVLVTNHLPTDGRQTRKILNECYSLIYFPHSSSAKIKYLLTEYLGMDKKEIAYMKRQNSRYCAIIKNYPTVYILETEIGLLSSILED